MGRNGSFSFLGQNDTVLIALFYYTNLFVPVSQCFPWNPGTQRQSYPPMLLTQVAPFLHGFVIRHSLISERWKKKTALNCDNFAHPVIWMICIVDNNIKKILNTWRNVFVLLSTQIVLKSSQFQVTWFRWLWVRKRALSVSNGKYDPFLVCNGFKQTLWDNDTFRLCRRLLNEENYVSEVYAQIKT